MNDMIYPEDLNSKQQGRAERVIATFLVTFVSTLLLIAYAGAFLLNIGNYVYDLVEPWFPRFSHSVESFVDHLGGQDVLLSSASIVISLAGTLVALILRQLHHRL